jgi:hypothetical protein
MPVPTSTTPPVVFPTLTRAEVDAARTSAWYDTFEDLTTPATIISVDELGERAAFLEVSYAPLEKLTSVDRG